MISHALSWASRGLPVFLLQPKRKIPFAGTHGFKDATHDEDAIRHRWAQNPDANIGIATGNGFFVLDLDGPEATSWFINASGRHGEPDRTLTIRTRESRFHLFFWAPCEIPCSASRIAPHVDIKGDGGYVVGAPSIHPDGHAYKIVRDLPIAEAPRWLTDLAIPDEIQTIEYHRQDVHVACHSDFNPKYVRAAIENELNAVASAGEGQRNIVLHSAAIKLGTLFAAGAISRASTEEALFAAAAASGLPAFEIRRTLASGFKFGERHPRQVPTQRGVQNGQPL